MASGERAGGERAGGESASPGSSVLAVDSVSDSSPRAARIAASSDERSFMT
jgi:hypothetical protein